MGKFASGVTWFYWIAALSVVNTVVGHFADRSFIIGLGITQIADGLAFSSKGGGLVLGLAVSVAISAIFAAFGYLGLKRNGTAIMIGLVLYSLDSLVFLLVKDWLSIGFHVFAAYSIFMGYKALKEIERLEVGKVQ